MIPTDYLERRGYERVETVDEKGNRRVTYRIKMHQYPQETDDVRT
jgi:hypothetical protein